ncbi:MAG: membrane dipeptidase [Candidatus Pacebacteria bacterium]|nr:membrane dipeptidase [Candidatus Paceibacterota bacterium]
MKKIIDLHQDLLLYLKHPELYSDTKENRVQTSFEKLKENNIKVAIVSAFPVPEKEEYTNPITNIQITTELETYNQYCVTHPEFVIIKNKEDLDRIFSTDGLYGLILHIEGINSFDPNTDWLLLEQWYQLGLRSIGPVWIINNPFGGGTNDEGGLTSLGRDLITWCEKKGVIYDFAHMNEETFWDATRIVTRPIFVSHGNARALADSVRNLSDAQLIKISETGGCCGIFFAKKYLGGDPEQGIEVILEHALYIISITGKESIAIGSDFGGIISGFIKGCESVDILQDFIMRMPSEMQEKIASLNALRVIRSHLK